MMQRIPAGTSMQIIFDDMRDAHEKLEFELERDSTLILVILLRGSIPRLSIIVHLIGQGAQVDIKGLYLLKDAHAVLLETKQIHKAPNTISSSVVKGILYDSSFVHYTGKIYVDKQARHTHAKQENKNIVLGSLARAISVPSLEVLTKHVRCSHGSAVGNIDQESVVYMQSRGLSVQQAQRLALQGFVTEIVQGMPEPMVECIKELIQ